MISYPADSLILLGSATMPTLNLTVPAAWGLPEGQIVQVRCVGGFLEEVDPVRRACTGRRQEFKVVNEATT